MSLSAWDQKSFEWVNRPHCQLEFKSVFEGLKQFRNDFDGRLWLEVFLLSGINAMPMDVEKIAGLCRELEPECIHLNTITRPPAEDFAAAVPRAQLETLTGMFDPPALIASGFEANRSKKIEADEAHILAMLRRRPCTIKQIEAAFGMHIHEVSKTLGLLLENNRIRADLRKHEVYYTCR